MKKLIITLLSVMPLCTMAQSEWEKPKAEQTQQSAQKKKELRNEKKTTEDAKYLEGAVPVVEGKVVFSADIDVPGKDAQQIYDLAYTALDNMTRGENQFAESTVALVNRKEHIIAARFKEWLVFQNTFLSLDRTVFNYTIIAKCTDGHINLTLSRISYAYETNRGANKGVETTAEKWITDKYGLNKSGTKLSRMSGKFRRKTIDRAKEIFDNIQAIMQK